MDYFAHPTAIIGDEAQIGAGTQIWHWVHVRDHARIGDRCTLGQNVYVAPTVVIGDGAKIQNNVSLFDGVLIGDDVFIGPSAVFTNVRTPRAHIDRSGEFETTHIEDGATIGANATIMCGITIGSYGFVGAGAVVTSDVADFALVVGTPARQIGWSCRCGVQLDTPSPETRCKDCGAQYRLDDHALRPTDCP